MNETQKPLNVKQVAEFLGLKPSYIYNLVFYGKLMAYKPGGKRLLFKLSDLEKYAFSNQKSDNMALSELADSILLKKHKKNNFIQGVNK